MDQARINEIGTGNDGLATISKTLPIALLRVREALMERMRPEILAHDITEQQWRVLRVLRENGPTDASSIAHRACILAPSLTRILKTLEARGAIETTRDDADLRKRVVSLTGDGWELIAAVAPKVRHVNSIIDETLGKERVLRLLDDLQDALDLLSRK